MGLRAGGVATTSSRYRISTYLCTEGSQCQRDHPLPWYAPYPIAGLVWQLPRPQPHLFPVNFAVCFASERLSCQLSETEGVSMRLILATAL